MRLDARDRFDALNAALDGRLFDPWSGALVWHSDPAETESLARLHSAHGAQVALVDRAGFDRLAPHVAEQPEVAYHAERDIAFAPGHAAGRLALAAAEAGAHVVTGHTVEAVETTDARVTGLRLAETVIAADAVVLAAGTGLERLLPGPGGPVMCNRPAGLVTLAATGPAPQVILESPEIEIRPGPPGYWLSAVSLGMPQMSLSDLAEDVRRHAARMMPGLRDLRVVATAAANRPIPDGGLYAGPAGGVEGLLAATAHPGVMFAPILAERIVAALEG